jgi:hypothetical protein
MPERRYVHWFKELSLADVPLVGGKNASLGELHRELTPLGVRVPNGFALTADAFRDALTGPGRGTGCTPPSTASTRATWRPSPAPAAANRSTPPACRPRPRPRSSRPTRLSGASTSRTSRSPSAAPPPPRICRAPASPASTRPTPTSRARRRCSTRCAAARRRCSPTGRSPTRSTRISTPSRWRCWSACGRWSARTSPTPA